jgi:hypothetical protein
MCRAKPCHNISCLNPDVVYSPGTCIVHSSLQRSAYPLNETQSSVCATTHASVQARGRWNKSLACSTVVEEGSLLLDSVWLLCGSSDGPKQVELPTLNACRLNVYHVDIVQPPGCCRL